MASVREIEVDCPLATRAPAPRGRATKTVLLAATAAAAISLMVGLSAIATPALAQEAAPAAAAPTEPPGIKWFAYVEAGATFNSNGPTGGTNYGHLFTDKTNQLVLNQLSGTVSKDLDPKAEGFDWGFKVQGFYGTDARYTHFLGILDTGIKERTQFDLVEANVLLHFPSPGAGGLDLKVGAFSTPLGAEVIAAPSNLLYSHSYIFNFGLPLKHTGALATLHLTPDIDLYGGIDSGVNTTLSDGDNNGAAAGIFGIGLNNLVDGKLTVLALTHVGPENPSLKAPLGYADANNENRWISDITATFKATDELTLITELNYIKDDLFNVDGGGIAQYVSYTLSPELTATLRAEWWRDGHGFFVAAFPGNRDFVFLEKGEPLEKGAIGPGVGTSYGELTLGLTWKPADLGLLDGLTLRPEVRYDKANHAAYDNLTKDDQFTFGVDLILPFGG
ncbi:putative OmpL-like beta-barrel porin-2 [Nitrospirillum amazonense]|uniref:Putative OmpL-like beta-barrel porin-2 n=1 Tax=Nitrospirillum amazonense TaxID=28077 RepID=A0A560FTL6_9PROT|nr:outer membrane beta-barrel protein [Nitrospirillum amazonense]TWB24840.1 putative OmpL-like beta-barrel porin-2 [Nitrospirillum amazonense]